MSYCNDTRYEFLNTRASDRSGVRNSTTRTGRSGRGALPKRMAGSAKSRHPNFLVAFTKSCGDVRMRPHLQCLTIDRPNLEVVPHA
jgi:hypothetical protein